MSHVIKILSLGVSPKYNTNWAVQPQEVARGLKFRIEEVRGLYYVAKNKGADQLHGCCAAVLLLCFCICKFRFSHDSANMELNLLKMEISM